MRGQMMVWLAVTAALTALPPAVLAQAFPSRPVQIVVPYPPGGATDNLARALAARLGDIWSQQVVVENKPGGNTLIGAQFVAKASADGHTLMLTAEATLVINPTLYAKLPYDPQKDFAPITVLVNVPQLLAVHPGVPATDLREFIALLKKNPAKFSYGSFGSGSTGHLNTERFKQLTGTDIVHVPYKGAAPAMTDLMGGQIEAMVVSIGLLAPQIRAGKLRAIAVSGDRRSPLLPEVPTFAEAGLSGYQAASWFCLVAPAATPQPVVARIHADVVRLLKDPEFREQRILRAGLDPVGNTPEQFADFIRSESAVWGRLVRDIGARIE